MARFCHCAECGVTVRLTQDSASTELALGGAIIAETPAGFSVRIHKGPMLQARTASEGEKVGVLACGVPCGGCGSLRLPPAQIKWMSALLEAKLAAKTGLRGKSEACTVA
jgi:hypothetical protein